MTPVLLIYSNPVCFIQKDVCSELFCTCVISIQKHILNTDFHIITQFTNLTITVILTEHPVIFSGVFLCIYPSWSNLFRRMGSKKQLVFMVKKTATGFWHTGIILQALTTSLVFSSWYNTIIVLCKIKYKFPPNIWALKWKCSAWAIEQESIISYSKHHGALNRCQQFDVSVLAANFSSKLLQNFLTSKYYNKVYRICVGNVIMWSLNKLFKMSNFADLHTITSISTNDQPHVIFFLWLFLNYRNLALGKFDVSSPQFYAHSFISATIQVFWNFHPLEDTLSSTRLLKLLHIFVVLILMYLPSLPLHYTASPFDYTPKDSI